MTAFGQVYGWARTFLDSHRWDSAHTAMTRLPQLLSSERDVIADAPVLALPLVPWRYDDLQLLLKLWRRGTKRNLLPRRPRD